MFKILKHCLGLPNSSYFLFFRIFENFCLTRDFYKFETFKFGSALHLGSRFDCLYLFWKILPKRLTTFTEWRKLTFKLSGCLPTIKKKKVQELVTHIFVRKNVQWRFYKSPSFSFSKVSRHLANLSPEFTSFFGTDFPSFQTKVSFSHSSIVYSRDLIHF